MRELAHNQAQELRLVGVHEDGAHLLVSAANGDVFRLPLDEALRRAVSRPAPQRPAPNGSDGAAMSPRQIQAEIRGGATAEEVAASSGTPLARVQRFEGPVLAEREHMARRAQAVEVPGRIPTQEGLRGPLADRPTTLGEMVAYRLSLHGVAPDSVEWDSWRRPDGQWTVVARFALPGGSPSSIGEEPPATWTYHPVHRTIANANRWAQQLSELEPLDGPSPRRRLAAVSDRPFDVEAPELPHRSGVPGAAPIDREAELLDVLRARRGQRLGVDEEADDALALLLTHGIPAAHPRPETVEDTVDKPTAHPAGQRREDVAGPSTVDRSDGSDGAEDRSGPDGDHAAPGPLQRGGITSLLSRLNARTHGGDEGPLGLHSGMSTATREITVVPAPRRGDTDRGDAHRGDTGRDNADHSDDRAPSSDHEPPAGSSTQASAPETAAGPGEPGRAVRDAAGSSDSDAEARPRSSRAKRSSVPSWDEIVFGTKGD
ncbi:hypothetical protein GCM10027449_32770 [Sinomonas notoginsengisoli]|uniref:septation protein SepH n=1 Tax=Sinomonas notoginsengisoli TaxID=1457311 RepID=UPI001EEF6DAF|nr:septation protein SepH [Sinomonas notoginsengisoli]